MNVSIIINTYNRAGKLRECLSNLRHLEYGPFEVVVVNGPSTDATEEVCQDFKNSIKHCRCPEVNLSMSRNIGIAAAAGDICAFIDDDALTHPAWLAEIIAHYDSAEVVGVGGYTLDNTGIRFQATATLCDRLGQDYPVANHISTELFCFPGSPLYPSLLGTNSSFRRSALLEIGGFDETYAYFLDETDVCLRLVDRGGILRHAPKAIIYHRFAASHLRNIRNVPKSRFMPIRSRAYFMLRHARDLFTPSEIATKVEEYCAETKRCDEWNAIQGRISWAAKSHMEQEIDRGIEEAYRLSQSHPRTPLGPDNRPLPFHLFPRSPSVFLRVAFISRGFPPDDTNGIARWVSLMAKGLASRGHQVHVITLAQQEPSTSYEDGIWIHRIDAKISSQLENFIKLFPIPSDILHWSAAAYEALLAIGFHNLDIVSAPIWDVEGIVSQLLSPIPVVASLHTTYKLAETYKPDWERPVFRQNHVQKVSFAEKFLFECSPWFLGNSDAIVNDIENAYQVRIRERTRIVPHGVEDVDFALQSCESSHPVVLFVGRQETRKGFDTAIQAAVIICRNNPTVKFQFIGAPCRDSKCEKSIQEIPAEFVQRIEILGYLSEKDLQEAYKKCDVFIAPSRYESFGLIAIEAMRYGKAVIVGDRGGLREVVQNEVNGFLVDADSPEALAQSIERLLSDPGLREKFSIEARRIFLSKFTVEKMAGNAELALMDFANLRGY